MNHFSLKIGQQTTLKAQNNCKTLAMLRVELEEIEEQIDSLEQSRTDLLKKIAELT